MEAVGSQRRVSLPFGFAIKADDGRENERVATCLKATLVLGAKAEAEVNRTVEIIVIVFIVEDENTIQRYIVRLLAGR